MCGGYTSYTSEVPAVRTPAVETKAETAAPVKSSSRRINPAELAKQVATLVQNSGKVSRTDQIGATALTEYKLRRGQTRAMVQTASASQFSPGATYVEVKRGRKTLLTASADGLGATAEFSEAKFTPGSWTKPFRLVSLG